MTVQDEDDQLSANDNKPNDGEINNSFIVPEPSVDESSMPVPPALELPPPAEPRESILELIYGIIFTPANTIRQIIRQRPLGAAIVIFLSAQVLATISAMFSVPANTPEEARAVAPLILLLVGIPGGAIGWFFGTAVFHLLAEFFGGNGHGYDLFLTLGFSNLPLGFLAPVALLLRGTNPLLYGVIAFAIYLWVGTLMALSIREVYHFTSGRATLVLLLPGIGGFILLVIMIIVMAVLMLAIFQGIGNPFAQ